MVINSFDKNWHSIGFFSNQHGFLNNSNMKKLIFLLFITGLVACSTVPLTNRSQFTAIPSSQMLELSNESYNSVLKQKKLSNNTSQINELRLVGRRVAKAVENYLRQIDRASLVEGYEWEFNLIAEDPKNAWCMPGGKIAFYEGIIPVCQNENGIAAVMAHEIAHAVAKHGNERMSQQLALQMGGMALNEALQKESETTIQLAMTAFGVGAQLGVILPYSRKHEKEADELGLYFMAMAGYDPREAPELWKRMQAAGSGGGPPEFLSTHPDPEKRINHLNSIMPKAMEYLNQNK
jgi:predicted Zn-dependent protease